MALSPIVPRAEKHKRARRPLLLEALANDPALSVKQLCAVCGASEQFVRAMVRSDAFQKDLSDLIRAKYGSHLEQVRQDVLKTQSVALKRLRNDLENDALAPTEHHSAAKLALEHSEKAGHMQGAQSPSEQGNGVSVTINVNDLSRAQELAKQRSDEIELEDQSANTSAPAGQIPNFSRRDQEGEPL